VIENIHTKIHDAVKRDTLDMSDWHICETTHCRAGFVVHIAGKEGYDLEEQTSTAFAAFQIYKKSSSIKVSFNEFYKSNEEAMKDIERCTKEENSKAS